LFLVDSRFILPKLNEEEEGVTKPILEAQATGSTKILGTHFWSAPIKFDEEMEDV
jgi:hypothetical protein